MTTMTSADLISALAGIAPGSTLAALREQRPEAMRHAQGSVIALFEPVDAVGLSRGERFLVAAHVARLHEASAAQQHFEALARAHEATAAPSEVRVQAMLRHAELLSLRPVDATPDDLQRLADAGFSTREIVTLSQVISFVSFFVRVLAALQALGASARASLDITLGPNATADAPGNGEAAHVLRPGADLRRPERFTIEQLAWTPWLEPLDMANASPAQEAALDGQRRNSPYFRLLALEPQVLVERTATDRGIFYTQGGAPRQERELSAAATSRLNGCIYCTSVHARLASQLSKREDDIARLLERGVAPGTELGFDARWQAVVDAAVALAPTPPTLDAAHVAQLRGVGLGDLEILDVLQAAAFFAWANRLMLTLGEPHYE